eukprot:gi/632991526/ref/XP_007884668.1/ PREDICTED: small integral membrane protein 11 [Callorhinchus milii]
MVSAAETLLQRLPLLLYLLAAKTLLLCLAFSGVKCYRAARLRAREPEGKKRR